MNTIQLLDTSIPIDTASLSYKLYPHDPTTPAPSHLVVFIGGLRSTMNAFDAVATSLMSVASVPVLCYDRWNNGASSAPPASRQGHNDLWTQAEDLYTLISETQKIHELPEKLILVGSSIGCGIVRLCLQRYADIAGRTEAVVFLDSYMSNTDFVSLFPEEKEGEPEELTRTRRVVAEHFHPSLENPEGLSLENARELLPEADRPSLREEMEVVVVGHDAGHTAESMEQTMGLDAGCWLKYVQGAWDRWNEGLARLSGKGRRVTAEGSGHFIYRDRPELVVEVVAGLVKERELAVEE